MLETLEPKIEDNEILTGDEAEELRCAMQAKISEAVALGVFTDAEAKIWEDGFEACDQLKYMQNLVEVVDDFIASGLEVVEQISSTLDTDLLTEREKIAWQTQAELLSFPDKCKLVQELSNILSSVSHCKQELMRLLRTNQMPDKQVNELVKSFEKADSVDKEAVVTRAMLFAADAKAQHQVVQARVRVLISTQQFKMARELLYQSTANSSNDLMSEIDAAEITQVRQAAKAA
ncbi:hypothetical protein KKE14_02110 [Patescibacteria group bacterium]|nr:hypothetical protein [Patescibacteria group bacterium]